MTPYSCLYKPLYSPRVQEEEADDGDSCLNSLLILALKIVGTMIICTYSLFAPRVYSTTPYFELPRAQGKLSYMLSILSRILS